MAGAVFSVTQADIALAASTAKNVMIVTVPTGSQFKIKKVTVDFDGVTSGNNQALVDFYKGATGTATGHTSISANVINLKNSALTTRASLVGHSSTGGITLNTAFESHRWHPTTDHTYEWALGDEPEVAASSSFVIRCTAAQVVNVTVTCVWEE
jgi:hypothetical protein